MKQYFKPIFRIAGSVQNPGAQVNCATSDADLQLIADILGITVEDLGADNTFAVSEDCKIAFPIDFYCKFTSVANGAEAAFQS